jgi:hypothetical protein
MPTCTAQMMLSAFAPSNEARANTDESYAKTIEDNLLANVCRDEKQAARRNEEIAAALEILWIRHFIPLLKA